jgi:hypothetical protein
MIVKSEQENAKIELMVRVLRPQSWVTVHKRLLLVAGVIAVLVTGSVLWYFFHPIPNPLPPDIKREVNFKLVYPTTTAQVDDTSWKYQSSEQVLTYQIKGDNYTATVTEQEVPLQYRDDQAAYDRFIGSLRPYANFNVPLGSVTLANFVTAGDFNPTGLAGILKTHNTLIIIHPDSQLSQDDWESLFDSLKVSS